jgi:hypothetical protein
MLFHHQKTAIALDEGGDGQVRLPLAINQLILPWLQPGILARDSGFFPTTTGLSALHAAFAERVFALESHG